MTQEVNFQGMRLKNKLHIGCGGIRLPDYTNIDFIKSESVDLMHNLEKPFPEWWKSDSFDEILGYHVFEHLAFNGIEQVLNSWYRVLKPEGKLILEMPDFDKTVANYMKNPNDITKLANIFGCQEHAGQFHKWGWNQTRLRFALQATGFKEIVFKDPTDYHAALEPSMRVEAIK